MQYTYHIKQLQDIITIPIWDCDWKTQGLVLVHTSKTKSKPFIKLGIFTKHIKITRIPISNYNNFHLAKHCGRIVSILHTNSLASVDDQTLLVVADEKHHAPKTKKTSINRGRLTNNATKGWNNQPNKRQKMKKNMCKSCASHLLMPVMFKKSVVMLHLCCGLRILCLKEFSYNVDDWEGRPKHVNSKVASCKLFESGDDDDDDDDDE